MTNEELQINSLLRTIGTLTTSVGLTQIKNSASHFDKVDITSRQISESLNKIGLGMTELDYLYKSTSAENYDKITETIWGVIKNFKWVAEFSDCDDRSAFATALCSLIFGLNTLPQVYCEVENINTGNKSLHWTNMTIDKDLNCKIFDVDNYGLSQKITSNNFVMGNWRYKLIQVRIY